jgi:hypothetical protein
LIRANKYFIMHKAIYVSAISLFRDHLASNDYCEALKM